MKPIIVWWSGPPTIVLPLQMDQSTRPTNSVPLQRRQSTPQLIRHKNNAPALHKSNPQLMLQSPELTRNQRQRYDPNLNPWSRLFPAVPPCEILVYLLCRFARRSESTLRSVVWVGWFLGVFFVCWGRMFLVWYFVSLAMVLCDLIFYMAFRYTRYSFYTTTPY